MAQYAFGSGSLWGTRTDVANSTPQMFGALQDVSVDFSATSKMLYGQNQFPLAVARGTGKISGKAKLGTINGRLFNDLFFGVTTTTGLLSVSQNEGPTAIPATPFHITVANSSTWVQDLGVVDAVTGVPFVYVVSSPAAGQYSVSSGVYTFSSADNVAGRSVYISYTYSASGTAPNQVTTVANQLLGVTPTFSIVFTVQQGGKSLTMTLLQCVSSKLSIATKQSDFVIPEFDFDCFANASGNLLTYSTTE